MICRERQRERQREGGRRREGDSVKRRCLTVNSVSLCLLSPVFVCVHGTLYLSIYLSPLDLHVLARLDASLLAPACLSDVHPTSSSLSVSPMNSHQYSAVQFVPCKLRVTVTVTVTSSLCCLFSYNIVFSTYNSNSKQPSKMQKITNTKTTMTIIDDDDDDDDANTKHDIVQSRETVRVTAMGAKCAC
jgi:hypothetical protein